MNVSAWSIRNPIPAILLFMLLTLAGVLAFRAMKVQNFPDIDLPMVIVTAALPGAAPAQLETEVARKLENSLATVPGVKHLYATISDGLVVITAEFRLEKPVQEAVDEVRSAVARVRSELPANVSDPVVQKGDLAGQPILTYTVASARGDDEALSWFVDDEVTRALLAVRGVGAVSRVGGVTRELRVELDPAQLLSRGATAAEVSRQLRQLQQDASGGRADVGGAEQSMRMISSVGSAEQLGRIDIALADGSPSGRRVRLNQLANVRDTVAEPRSLALMNGQPAVAFEITRSRGAGELDVAAGVRAALAALQAAHPDVVITEAFNFVDPAREGFEGSMLLMIEGAILAVLVVWGFLRHWRATLVAAAALPLSAIPTFAVMWLMGFTLNGVTLISLSLVVGILVDDAIVEIENIMRHLRDGKTPYAAAMEAADEIGMAVIATTFTLVAVFLPTAFMSGVVGRFFVQFGWTAAVAVLFSLLVARMLTPMMAAYLLKPLPPGGPAPRWLRLYERWASACLRHRWWTLAATAVFFVGSFMLVPHLGTGFIPPDDLSQTQVHVTLPPGATLAQTHSAAEAAREIVRMHPQVLLVYTAIGGGRSGGDPFAPAGQGDVRKAVLTINMKHRTQRPGISKQAIEAELRVALQAVPGARLRVGLGASNEKFALVLAGPDGPVLAEHAVQVERELRGIPGIGGVSSTAGLQRPEVVVRPDFARMADLGVSSAAIADTLRIATAGDYDNSLAKLNLAHRQVPVVVRLRDDARQDLALLERLAVPGGRGPVMLGNVATLGLEAGPIQLDRFDRQRSVSFEVELNTVPLGEVEAQALALPSLQQMPPGVSRAAVGDAEGMADLFSGFALAMAAGVLCIYAVLVLLFKDFVQPVTILAALVLSIPGAFLALFVSHTALTMPSMIGLIMLMGIATKNSILLVDYVVMARRDHGLPRWEALLDACRKRARPIVMTTLAMGAGMLPIALGFGADASFRAPMATVVIGGLITSTFLSLLVIPVVFTFVDDAVVGLKRRLGRRPARVGPVNAPPGRTD